MAASHPTLEQFLASQWQEPYAQVLEVMSQTAVELSKILSTAPLTGKLGLTGNGANSTNATGDVQKKMDLIANDLFVERLTSHHLVHRIVSEELNQPLVAGPRGDAPLLLAMDPLDGSSNLDVDGVLATIFAIYRDETDPFPTGRDVIASGYFLYGPSLILVMSTGRGVHLFTLNSSSKKFELTQSNIRCPSHGEFLCANVSHYSQWPDSVQAYVHGLIDLVPTGHSPSSFRYSGAMANDVHRILLEGGIYLYPPDTNHWTGKIRLLYESIPMAFLFDQAGGASSNCAQSLLDVPILEAHQQDHTALGSAENVRDYVETVTNVQRRLSA